MCLCAYIGTDQKLEIGKFVQYKTLLYLEEPSEDELKGLRNKFTKKYIYYIGSETGCSCGFMYEEDEDLDEEDYSIESPKELIKFLKKIAEHENIEFYSCWESEWDLPIKFNIELNVNDLTLENYFGPNQLEFITFNNE